MHYPRIKDLREDCGKRQDEIAQYLHIDRTVYGRYERGIREAPSWMIYRLALYYNISADYILGLKTHPEDAFPPKSK